MKNLVLTSVLGSALFAAQALAQELDENYASPETVEAYDESLDQTLPEDEAAITTAEDNIAATLAEEDASETTLAAKTPEEIRAELTAVMNLPVYDVNDERIGIAVNAVMKEDRAQLLVVKLDNVLFGNKLRAVDSKEAATIDDGGAIGLATLTKAALKDQTPFEYQAEMVTLLPATDAQSREKKNTPTH